MRKKKYKGKGNEMKSRNLLSIVSTPTLVTSISAANTIKEKTTKCDVATFKPD